MTAERKETKVTFLPAGLTVTARAGDTILDAALDNSFPLEHECGGNCACTTCLVQVESGGENLSPPEAVEIDRIRTAQNWTPQSRLGCQAIVRGGSVTLFVPEEPSPGR